MDSKSGETYHACGETEMKRIDVVRAICAFMDELAPKTDPRDEIIAHVTDLPWHDFRHAINSPQIVRELGWRPRERFAAGLRKTVRWHFDNRCQWARIRAGTYNRERPSIAPTEAI